MRSLTILLAAPAILCAQTCTILNTANCPSTGSPWAGPPTLQSYLSGEAQSFTAAESYAEVLPQPHVTLSAQIVPATQSYMSSDPVTCPNSGICIFNNLSAIQNYINSMINPWPTGAGLKSVDINVWLGPMFEASQYATACATYGTCYTPSSTNATWYANSLAVYDTIIPYIKSKGVQVRIAPAPSGDVLTTCGIARGVGNFTEAQLQNCTTPLYVVFVERYHIDFLSVLHEPCGLMAVIMNTSPSCMMSVSDVDNFIRNTAADVRATTQYSSIKLGAGALIADDSGDTPNHSCANPGSGSYWCDWINNLMAGSGANNVLDYGAVHIYPNNTGPSSGYFSGSTGGVLGQYGQMIDQIPSSKIKNVDESSALRWTNSAGNGDAGSYLGCGSSEWLTDGSFAAWTNSVLGNWAGAHHVQEFSLYSSEALIYISTDPNNTHCSQGVDNYEATVMSKAGAISAEGLVFGRIAQGFAGAMQGKSRLTGRSHLGH